MLQLVHVTVGAPGAPVVDDVNLLVAPAYVCGLVGPAGSGKSMLLRAIVGLEPLTAGKVLFERDDLTPLAPEVRPVSAALWPPVLFPHLSVEENVAFALPGHALSAHERDERIRPVLAELGLERLRERVPSTLSATEAATVAVARAMVREAPVLLLDDPWCMRAPRDRERLARALYRWAEEKHCAVLYATADVQGALGVTDQIAVLRDGRLEQDGEPREVVRTPASEFVATYVADAVVCDATLRPLPRGGWRIELPFGDLQADTLDGAERLTRHAVVRVAVRPDAVTLAGPRETADAAGFIRDYDFAGDHWRAQVEVAEGFCVPVRLPLAIDPAIGAELRLRLHADGLAVVGREASEPELPPNVIPLPMERWRAPRRES